MNIRLLLHSLWKTWRESGYDDSRPPSFAFMPRADPVQQAVLAKWGVTTLTEEIEDPGHALTSFLSKLADAVAR